MAMFLMVKAKLIWVPLARIRGHGLRPLKERFVFNFAPNLIDRIIKHYINSPVGSFGWLFSLLVPIPFPLAIVGARQPFIWSTAPLDFVLL